MTSHELASDTRITFGASCTWWGSIYDIGKRGNLPCCPVCRNMLFEMPDEAQWWKGVDAYEAKGNPGYRKMIEWSRKRCFPSRGELEAAWKAAAPQPRDPEAKDTP